jgi:hypothetical protein
MKKKTNQTIETPRPRATMAPADFDITLDSDGDWLGPGYRFHEYISMINTSTAARRSGINLRVDDVIAGHQEDYRKLHEKVAAERERLGDEVKGVQTPVELAAASDDLVIWEGGKVKAVLRPEPAGRAEYLVTLFPDA